MTWIDVSDKLPELEIVPKKADSHQKPKSVRVLCACKQRSGKVFVKEGFYELWDDRPVWRISGSIDAVTHWMPLPNSPEDITR